MMGDLRTLYHLIKPVRGRDHRQRMENFYKQQSSDYDRFRKKLLAGRRHLYQQIARLKAGGIWIDFGSGTGACLDDLSNQEIEQFEALYLVDVSASLLAMADKKIKERGLKNVKTIESDILQFRSPEFAEIVTFSYSLTMTPQWYRALDHAYRSLSPQGLIGVVDFYVSSKHPLPGLKHHDRVTRHFWPVWFSYDNVFLNPDHLPYLLNKFDKLQLFEGENPIPLLPLGRVPYYSFIGQKN